MKVKKRVLIFLVGILFLVGTTFVLHAEFKDKNVEVKDLLSGIEKEINSKITYSPGTIKNNNFNIYRSDEIKFQDLRYVGKKTYEKIAEICSNIDFMGSFKSINLKKDPFYREQYLNVLKGDESYINRLAGDSDLVEFDLQNMKKYTYYYFDMNGNGVPELIISCDSMRYMYIFSYDAKINKVKLLDIEHSGSSFFLGNNKMGAWYDGTGLTYEFYEVDENGNKNSKIFFHSEGYLNDITKEEDAVYMVGFGEGSEEIENYKSLAKEMDEQLFEENSTYFLRVSKEQYDQLTQNYFKSRETAEENIKKVTYTFDELFS